MGTGRPQDPRYDWLYDGQSGEPVPPDATRPMPTSGSAAGGYGQSAGSYGQAGAGYGQGGYPPGPTPHVPQAYDYDRDDTYGGPGGPPGPSGPIPPAYERPMPRYRRRRKRPWLRILIGLVVAYLVFLVAAPIIAWTRIEQVAYEPAGSRPAQAPGTTYLVVGSDSREGLSAEQRKDLGTGNAGGRRTDTIMLLHVPDSGPPVLISVPRDSYVPVAGHGRSKVNASFSWGGPKLLTQTVENATGMRIDAYVEVGFGGFVGMTDAVNGVDVCLPKAMNDKKAHIDLPAGCQTLDGKNALGYVRARYSDPKGDLGRVERQQKFLSALAGKAMSPVTILNPIAYARFGLATGDALTMGEGSNPLDLARFALAMHTVSSGGGISMTVPVAGTGMRGGQSVVLWNRDAALKLFHALKAGSPVPTDLVPSGSGSGGSGSGGSN